MSKGKKERPETILRKYYYDPEYGTVGSEKLYHRVKDKGITRKQVREFLDKQELYQVNKQPDSTGSFVPMYPLQEFQIDLIHIDNTDLNQASYGLCCIDIFSKKAYIELIKKKDETNVVTAMEVLIKKMGTPEMVYCDEGSEFTSKAFKDLMEKYGIKIIYTTRHAPFVERFNRTIKNMMSKYLQMTDSKTITNALPKLIKNYNTSFHSSIGMAPNDVNANNQIEVWENINQHSKQKKREKIEPGDKVRVLIKERAHDKKYKPRWSKEVYTVTKKSGSYYHMQGLHKKYLRAHILSADTAEKPTAVALLENTKEGKLKDLAKAPRIPQTKQHVEPMTRTKRIIKKPKKLDL